MAEIFSGNDPKQRRRGYGFMLVLLLLFLCFFCCACFCHACAEDLPDIFTSFISDSRWQDGVYWGNREPEISSWGTQCAAYCGDFTKYCFGIDNPTNGTPFYDAGEIRAGDVIEVINSSGGTHWFCVLKRNGDLFYTAEGNAAGGKVSIGWNYTITGSNQFNSDHAPLSVGYHFLNSEFIGKDFYAVILNKSNWMPISEVEGTNRIYLKTEIGSPRELWRFQWQDAGMYVISSCQDGRALEMTDGIRTNGTQAVASGEFWGGMYQQWLLIARDGGYILKSAHYQDENWVLELRDNGGYDGNTIQIGSRNNSASQIWSIYRGSDRQLGRPVLTVTPGTTVQPTRFEWTNAVSASGYNLKIFRDTLYEGEAFHVLDAVSGTEVSLPAGNYYAYVDALNYYSFLASDPPVQFVVTEASGEYRITYNANGGTGAPSPTVKHQGQSAAVSTQKPVRSSFTFIGWSAKPSADKAEYLPGDLYSKNADLTLYAVWLADTAINSNALRLPASLQSIGTEAFEGVTAYSVTVPSRCTRIGSRAFRNSAICKVILPADCVLEDNVFDGCGLVYLHSTEGSYAQQYCQSHSNCIFVK